MKKVRSHAIVLITLQTEIEYLPDPGSNNSEAGYCRKAKDKKQPSDVTMLDPFPGVFNCAIAYDEQ